MKKLVSVALMLCIFAVGVASVYANPVEGTASLEENMKMLNREFDLKELRGESKRFTAMKEFQEELQQLNKLKIERLELRIEVTERQGTILDLYINARDNEMQEELKQAREARQEIKDINSKLKETREAVKEDFKSFKEAVKNNETDEAREYINNVITNKTAINNMMTEKISVMDDIIEILTVEI
ncbi:hypothetical protein F8154_13855 [Alkaliphilus pronyensis]|uniref:OmpH family outer membrane protein n=1 Tax=Alkaliphilus pronyensis TaxID=1482732 RepID=A0A6I0F7X7_9FIRM|nr:hypothetical protein [Alkaliphilus pronyensis]KAB3530480.1 hypothetical protein F8154_13855 [Alkaliphilus pronyensis]